MASWRMEKKCDNCPFHVKGPGYLLRRSLRPGRWQEILVALRTDHHFPCHKTVDEEQPELKMRVCAGAIEWQERRGLSSNYQRVCERLDAAFAERAAKKKEATP